MPIWPSQVTVGCDVCPKASVYDNPGKHSLTIVLTKALKDGWYLPRAGKTMCPECVRKLIAQQDMKPYESWHTPTTKTAVKALETLPEPPRLLGV